MGCSVFSYFLIFCRFLITASAFIRLAASIVLFGIRLIRFLICFCCIVTIRGFRIICFSNAVILSIRFVSIICVGSTSTITLKILLISFSCLIENYHLRILDLNFSIYLCYCLILIMNHFDLLYSVSFHLCLPHSYIQIHRFRVIRNLFYIYSFSVDISFHGNGWPKNL